MINLGPVQVHVDHCWVHRVCQSWSGLLQGLIVDAVAQLFILLAQLIKLSLIFILLLIVVLIVENVTQEGVCCLVIAECLSLVHAGSRILPLVCHQVAHFLETDARSGRWVSRGKDSGRSLSYHRIRLVKGRYCPFVLALLRQRHLFAERGSIVLIFFKINVKGHPKSGRNRAFALAKGLNFFGLAYTHLLRL